MKPSNTHKHEIITEFLREFINSNKSAAKTKIPSENELALKFSVSRITARQAISSLVNEGLLFREKGSGTYVKIRKKIIGVLMSYIDSYIFTDIIKGIDNNLRKNEMNMILTSSGNNVVRERECLDTLFDQNIDGLILEPAKSAVNKENISFINKFIAKGVDVVFINGYIPGIKAGRVLTDDRQGMKILVDKLVENGHEKIAGIFVSDLIQGERRYEGFCDVLSGYGIKVEKESVMWYEISSPKSEIELSIDKFLDSVISNKYSAVCCYNDMTAQIVIEILTRKGIKVPGDISVTGFDGSQIARLSAMYYLGENSNTVPRDKKGSIATVSHPCAKAGEEAVNLLGKLISKEIDFTDAVSEMPTEFFDGRSLGSVNIKNKLQRKITSEA